jgi:hypothetical protein
MLQGFSLRHSHNRRGEREWIRDSRIRCYVFMVQSLRTERCVNDSSFIWISILWSTQGETTGHLNCRGKVGEYYCVILVKVNIESQICPIQGLRKVNWGDSN